MKNVLIIILVCILQHSVAFAQARPIGAVEKNIAGSDTLYANTEPESGLKVFLQNLETALSKGDTSGKRYRLRIDNIGFFVSKTGTIDSAWIIFRPRPIHEEIIKVLKATKWTPAEQDGQRIVSHQELLDQDIYLTKAALKRHRQWRSLIQRIISPY
jgi:hypothetical protein